jgi:hypothetical protein
MRGFDLFKNGVGVIAVVLFLALASPGVQIVPIASAEEPISAAPPAPRCEAGNPVSADESMAAVVERLRDRSDPDGSRGKIVMLNNRGYNYGPHNSIDLDRIVAEGRGASHSR